jgi:uncharacterized membrane protein
MTESAKKTRLTVPLVATAVLLVPTFVAGVLTGRSILGRRSPANEERAEPASNPRVQRARRELAACQEKRAARSEPRATPSATDAPSGEANHEAAEPKATAPELERELKRCKKSEILVSAEVCSAAAREFTALMASPQNGWICGPKSRAADLIEDDYASCAAFAAIPADVRSDDFTKEESSLIAEAVRVHQTLTEDELLRRLKEFVFTCTEVPPTRPPGFTQAPNQRR